MLLDILEEHLEEVEILWSRRRSALRSPALDLAGLEALEERLRAHLDGVTLGAREAPGRLETRLRGGDADETFAAAAALLLTHAPGSYAHVLDALCGATPHGRAGIVEALCHLPLAGEVERALRATFDAAGDGKPGPALEVLSFHRLLLPAEIEPAVAAGDAETRSAAARAIGRVGGEAAWAIALSEDADVHIRDAALAAAARRGQPWALERTRYVCRDPRRATPGAIRLLACLGDRNDVGTLHGLASGSELGEAALEGLVILGLRECIDPVLDLMAEGRLARAAGEAFHRITGLEVPARWDEPQSPESEDCSFEDLRPLPDVEALGASWRKRAADIVPGQRRRCGRVLAAERWTTAPQGGDLKTRREELTRLWARAPGLFPNLELDSPAARQRMAA